MTGVLFSMTWDDRQFQKVCRDLIGRGVSLRPMLTDIGEELVDLARDRFRTKEDPEGEPWEPLKPATLERKDGKGSLLVFDGYLEDLLRAEVDDRQVDIGSSLVYSALHQFGGTPGMRPSTAAVPARPFLGIGPLESRSILEIAQKAMKEALSQNGGNQVP